MRDEIHDNLRICPIKTNVNDIEKYFIAVTFNPDDIVKVFKGCIDNSRKGVLVGAFLDTSCEPVARFHYDNFFKVGEHVKDLIAQSPTQDVCALEKQYPIFSIVNKASIPDSVTGKNLYSEICTKAGVCPNELLVGILVASRGCDEILVCPDVKKDSEMLHDCINNSLYIDFQVTLIHFRGFGIGEKLISKGFEYYRHLGLSKVSTMTANQNVARFHEMLGSSRLADIPNYYHDGTTGILYCNRIR